MYLHDTMSGSAAVKFCSETLKIDKSEFDLDAVSRVEVFATSFTDEGEDYCEYRVYGHDNKVLAVRREQGY